MASPFRRSLRLAAAIGGLGLGFVGCKLSDVSRAGPKPVITGVTRSDTGFPTEAVICTDLPNHLTVAGTDFSPMPTNVLAGTQGVALPSVIATDEAGVAHELPTVTFDPATRTLSVAIAAGELAAGSYAVRVTNPNGNTTQLAAALVVVPPPTLASIDPIFGIQTSTTDVTLAGTGFRATGAGVPPAVTMSPEAGGMVTGLSGVALASSTQATGVVPSGLGLGFYDVTLTNPEGCSATLTHAFEVRAPPIIDVCNTVDPAFGWVNGRTTIEICANNANGHGLQAVPQAFLLVPDGLGGVKEVALIRQAMLSADTTAGGYTHASVMTAVVPSATEARGAGIAVGGPYSIKVVNPDGSTGTIANAFEVLPDPPPTIVSVTPEQGTTQSSTTLTITGTNFKDPGTIARIMLLRADQASGATCPSATCFICGTPSVLTATSKVACAAPSTTMAAGGYVVRYEHTDDGAFADFAAFTVTNPSANISGTSLAAMPVLGQARFGHAAALGRDDLGTRFAYAIGGLADTAGATALDSVEVASISRFGALGQWTAIRSRLPAPRSGAVAFVRGRYVFVLGGRDAAGAPVATGWRARILGADTAPAIDPPTLATDAASTLAAGTYIYRVAAVLGAGGDSPGGETLTSDPESIVVSQGKSVHLTWQALAGAVSYRIYRTAPPPTPAYSGTERLLATGVLTASFDDNGSAPLDTTTAPLPAGALGAWVDTLPLSSARAEAAVTVAPDPGGNPYVFVSGGATDLAGARLATVDVAAISVGGDGVASLGTFAAAAGAFTTGRSEHLTATVDELDTPVITGNHKSYLLIAQGYSGAASLDDIQVATIGTGGTLAWTTTGGSASARRRGAMGVLMNSTLVIYGGQSTGYLNGGIGATCTNADPPPFNYSGGNQSASLSVARYRAAMLYSGGMFFAIGGRDGSTVYASVDRLSY